MPFERKNKRAPKGPSAYALDGQRPSTIFDYWKIDMICWMTVISVLTSSSPASMK